MRSYQVKIKLDDGYDANTIPRSGTIKHAFIIKVIQPDIAAPNLNIENNPGLPAGRPAFNLDLGEVIRTRFLKD